MHLLYKSNKVSLRLQVGRSVSEYDEAPLNLVAGHVGADDAHWLRAASGAGVRLWSIALQIVGINNPNKTWPISSI